MNTAMKSRSEPLPFVAAALILAAVQAGAALAAHWTFDADGSDSSGNAYGTTLHGNATIAAGGRLGGALRVDGSGDFASTHNGITSNFDGITGNNARSVTLWIKAEGGASNASVNDAFIGWGGTNATARNRFDLGLGNTNDSLLRVELNAGFAQSTTSTINFRDGNWHHVTLSHAGGNSVSLYADGKLYQTVNYSATPVNTTDVNMGVYLGCGVREGSGTNGLKLQTAYIGNPARFWQGLIDDAGIWDSAVSATDAALLNGLGRIGNNDLSTLPPAAALWAGAVSNTAVINGITWQKVTGLTGSTGDWSQVGGNNGVGSFIVLDDTGGGIRIVAAPDLLTWVGTAGGGTWDQGSTLHWKNASNTPAAFQDFNAVRFDDSAATGAVTLASGPLLPESLTFANETKAYTLSGGSWSSTGTLTKTGAAEVTLLSDSDFSGTATISAGTLRIGNGGTTGSLGYATITNDGALVIQRNGTLTFGADIAGPGTLDIAGPGTVILAGANTLTGGTTVSGGTMRATGSLASPVTVQSGGTLAAGPLTHTGTTTLANLTLAAGSRTSFRAGFNTGDKIAVTAVDGLSLNGSHSINLIPTEPWFVADEFTLFTYNTSYTGSVSNLQTATAPHGSYSFSDDTANSRILVRVDAIDTLVWKGNNGAAWDVNNTVNWTLLSNNNPVPYFGYDQVRFDGSAATTTVTLAESVPAGEVTFDFNKPTQYTLTGPGVLAGFGSVEKSGSGTLILTTVLTRDLILLGGTVQVGDGGTTGGLGNGTITNDGSLVFNRSDDISITNAITGTGSLVQQGGGSLTLGGGTDSYNAGNLAVNAGTLRIGAAESSVRLFPLSDSRTITINSGATIELLYRNAFGAIPSTPATTLVVDGGALVSSNGASGSVNILQDPVLRNGATVQAVKDFGGYATFQLQGTVTVGGSTPSQITTAGGNITVGNGTDNSGVTTFNVADVSSNPDADLTIGAAIRNSGNNAANVGALTKTGSGTLALTAANTYTGATQVNEGTLIASGSLANSAVTVASTATLAGNGNLGGPVIIQTGGTHALAVADLPANQVTRTITGALTLDPGNILTLTAATLPANGTYILATATGGITGTPTTVNLPAGITEPATVTISGNNLVLTVGTATSDYATWSGPSGYNLIGGPTGDDDNDGFTNFEEYAFGLNPTSGSSVSPVTAPNKTTGTFTYTRRRQSLTHLTYSYKSSTNLTGWNSFTPPVPVVSDNGNPVETITVTLPAALLAEDSLFLRVEAVEP
jgi:autotransporter-associated beta strand protein